jgi:iron complex transport system ATP-binding protein
MNSYDDALLLDFQHVTVRRGESTALHDISLRIPLQQNVVILGPNGCGKSSLIKTITRECYPLAGNNGTYVKILGEERWDVFELRKHLGIVQADTLARHPYINCMDAVLSGFFSTFSLWKNSAVSFDMRLKAQEVMSLLGIGQLATRQLCELSSGEAQRVLIARALAHQPRSLLLDEPLNNLDIRASVTLKEVLSRLAQDGSQIILVTHNIADIIPEIGRVIMLKNGHIIADGSKEEMLTSGTLSGLFDMKLRVIKEDSTYHLV